MVLLDAPNGDSDECRRANRNDHDPCTGAAGPAALVALPLEGRGRSRRGVDPRLARGHDGRRKIISFREIARVAFTLYPRRAILGLALIIGQAFLYNGASRRVRSATVPNSPGCGATALAQCVGNLRRGENHRHRVQPNPRSTKRSKRSRGQFRHTDRQISGTCIVRSAHATGAPVNSAARFGSRWRRAGLCVWVATRWVCPIRSGSDKCWPAEYSGIACVSCRGIRDALGM